MMLQADDQVLVLQPYGRARGRVDEPVKGDKPPEYVLTDRQIEAFSAPGTAGKLSQLDYFGERGLELVDAPEAPPKAKKAKRAA
jgi:hypothetical protein